MESDSLFQVLPVVGRSGGMMAPEPDDDDEARVGFVAKDAAIEKQVHHHHHHGHNNSIPSSKPVVEVDEGAGDDGAAAIQQHDSEITYMTRVRIGMILKRWKIVSRIGAGSFGETFVGVEVPGAEANLGSGHSARPDRGGRRGSVGGDGMDSDGEGETTEVHVLQSSERASAQSTSDREVCIKVEQDSKNVLRLEALALKKAQLCPQVVRYVGSGRFLDANFLVMERLGPNLVDLRRMTSRGIFSIFTMLKVGISCLKAIRGIHELGLIHRDIKPSNFVVGLNAETIRKCYLIDFGLARRYRRSNGEVRAARDDAGFRGTSRYASLRSHQHLDLGRVDDLWSLLFMLIEFATGTLPWRKYKEKDQIGRCKQETINVSLVHNLPREFTAFIEHLLSLGYASEPRYDFLVGLLERALERRNYPAGKLLDWEEPAVLAQIHATTAPPPSPSGCRSNQPQAHAAASPSGPAERPTSPPAVRLSAHLKSISNSNLVPGLLGSPVQPYGLGIEAVSKVGNVGFVHEMTTVVPKKGDSCSSRIRAGKGVMQPPEQQHRYDDDELDDDEADDVAVDDEEPRRGDAMGADDNGGNEDIIEVQELSRRFIPPSAVAVVAMEVVGEDSLGPQALFSPGRDRERGPRASPEPLVIQSHPAGNGGSGRISVVLSQAGSPFPEFDEDNPRKDIELQSAFYSQGPARNNDSDPLHGIPFSLTGQMQISLSDNELRQGRSGGPLQLDQLDMRFATPSEHRCDRSSMPADEGLLPPGLGVAVPALTSLPPPRAPQMAIATANSSQMGGAADADVDATSPSNGVFSPRDLTAEAPSCDCGQVVLPPTRNVGFVNPVPPTALSRHTDQVGSPTAAPRKSGAVVAQSADDKPTTPQSSGAVDRVRNTSSQKEDTSCSCSIM